MENIECADPANHPSPIVPHHTMFSFCLWRNWIRRNVWLFQKESKHIRDCTSQTSWLAIEHCSSLAVNHSSIKQDVPIEVCGNSNFIVQVDASYCNSTLSAGYAAVCREKIGAWVAPTAGKIRATDALLAETIAIKIQLSG